MLLLQVFLGWKLALLFGRRKACASNETIWCLCRPKIANPVSNLWLTIRQCVLCPKNSIAYCAVPFQWQQWSLTDEPLLIAPSACRAWTEHSERCWLASVAAVLDIGRERREVLGRWRVASCSDEYIRTAQRVVSQVQRAIVGGVLNDTEWQLQEIGIKDLEIHLRQAGESDSLIYNQLCAFDLSLAGWCCPVRPIAAHAAPDSPKPMENACNVAEVSAVAVGSTEDISPAEPVLPRGVVAAEGPNQETFRYFICITKNRRLRRLHRWDGCGTKPASQYRLKVLIVLTASSMMQLANIAGPVDRSQVLSQTRMTQALRQTAQMAA